MLQMEEKGCLKDRREQYSTLFCVPTSHPDVTERDPAALLTGLELRVVADPKPKENM